MVIQTKYRDIPWEEIVAAHGFRLGDNSEYWASLRGTPVSIMTPGVDGRTITDRCTELHYRVASGHPFLGEKKRTFVCPHIAEIGD